jgi:hypothetical protein
MKNKKIVRSVEAERTKVNTGSGKYEYKEETKKDY